jgi:NTP pyrophosphatase (non-canonical NTP hydrolase)
VEIRDWQHRYREFAVERGWAKETIEETIANLREEIKELEAAGSIKDVRHELADIYFYLLHLANLLEVDLESALEEKLKILKERS